METVRCPECGKEVEDITIICPECGYQLKKTEVEKTSVTENKKNRKLAIGMCIIGCILLILALRTITSSKYKIYVENYETCIAEYEENLEKANSYSWGILKSGYGNIASQYKDMADEAKKTIWIYRIKTIVLGGVGIVFIIGGYKKIKNGQEV